MSTPHAPSRRSGFSLVEVAIALALFVIGALAIVRIFPPALNVIRNNESRTAATQMGESTLAKLRNRNSPPPEAIFDVNSAGVWQDYPGAVVGTVNKNSSLPKSPLDADYDVSALGHLRYIYGEPHYVKAGQTILLNSALNRPFDTSLTITAFYDEIVEGVQISSDGYLDFSNAYLVSSPDAPFNDSANPNRPPDSFRRDDLVTYYVSYRWRECADSPACTTYTSIKGVLEEPLSIPDNFSGGYSNSTSNRVLAATTNTANRIVPGGVQIRMRRILPNPTTTAGKVSATAGSSGMYYVNYLSSDWRNMVDDSSPTPKSGVAATDPILPAIVRLPVNGLDSTFPTGTSGVVAASWAHSDQNTGDTLTPTSVDAKRGEVEYSFQRSDWQYAPRIRTVYRTLDGWAHQLSVAPRFYIPYDAIRTGGNFPREPWREYFWSDTNAVASAMMYFHPSEAGKTVSISFINGSGAVVNSVCTIGDDLIDRPSSVTAGFMGTYLNPTTGTTMTNTKVAWMYITDAVGNNIPANSILSVRGLSVRARTAWLNGDRYNQVIVPGYRAMTQ